MEKFISERYEETPSSYDSRPDTWKHMSNIKAVMELLVIQELFQRSYDHDKSKLQPPEKECYDKYIPLLREEKYGTPAYMKLRESMEKEGLDHHYKVNRHHPEHFKDGVNGMNLIDFVEMICDWFAASLVSDTTFVEGLPKNAERNDLPPMIVNIIKNTYNDYFKDFEEFKKGKKKDTTYGDSLKLQVYETERVGLIGKEERDQLLLLITNIIADNNV